MDRREIEKKVAEVLKLANAKFGYSKPAPSVSFYDRGAAAGIAYPVANRLAFNEVLAKQNPAVFDDVVTHEVGHLVTKAIFPKAKQAHGPEFKMVTRALGGSGTTYHNFDVSSVVNRKTKTRYAAKCNCKTHYITKNAMENVNRFVCTNCKSQLLLTGEVIKRK